MKKSIIEVFVATIVIGGFFALLSGWNAFMKEGFTATILIKIVATFLATFCVLMYLSVNEKTTNQAEYIDNYSTGEM